MARRVRYHVTGRCSDYDLILTTLPDGRRMGIMRGQTLQLPTATFPAAPDDVAALDAEIRRLNGYPLTYQPMAEVNRVDRLSLALHLHIRPSELDIDLDRYAAVVDAYISSLALTPTAAGKVTLDKYV